jgi:D-glycero-alpha-D-manno-heptose-7-phosphate kinase
MQKSDRPARRICRARAPLRLGFAGGGTDVSPFCDEYGGAVLNASIGMYAYATLEERADGFVEFEICETGEKIRFVAGMQPENIDPFRIHFGVYNRIVRDFNEGQPLNLSLRTHCDAPPGSGLGSSSTVVVAMITAFQEFLNLPLGEYELAHLAFSIERTDLGMAGGKQDQYAAAFGGVNFMEFLKQEQVIVNPLRIKPRVLAELEASLALYFTGVSRSSATIIEEQAANVRAGNNEAISASLNLKQDAYDIKAALLLGDLPSFGRILNKSWAAKKLIASGVSTCAIDEIYELAICNGAYAGKVSGAGGGGFMMFLCDPSRRPSVVTSLKERGGMVFTPHFVETGAVAWRC